MHVLVDIPAALICIDHRLPQRLQCQWAEVCRFCMAVPHLENAQRRLVILGCAGRATMLAVVVAGERPKRRRDFPNGDLVGLSDWRRRTPSSEPFTDQAVVLDLAGFGLPGAKIAV